MSERGRILASSIGIMLMVSVCVTAVTISVLDRVFLEHHRARLTEVVQHRARILRAVARFDAASGRREPLGDAATTRLSQVVEVYESFGPFGETGEFTLARREGDRIMWLLEHQHADIEGSGPTSFSSELAEPMRRALGGESGTMVAIDSRGERVLAAYEPVPELGWGVVAKIDIAEIDRPFVRAGLLDAGIAIVVMILGVALMLRVTSPLISRIEVRVAERTAQLSQAVLDQKHLQGQLRAAASEAALAEERERRKLAIDLHDGLGQLLTVASIKLGMLRESIQDSALAPRLREVEAVIAEADQRASSLSFQLSPPVLHDVGLVAAAQWLAEDIELRFGLQVAVEDDGERLLLNEGTRSTLFRALRESLLNVAKHARADNARVRLWREDSFMKVTVEDEGVGFDPNADSSGYGLLSIGERLNHLGGRMQIESAPGEGTRICLMAPITAAGPKKARGSA